MRNIRALLALFMLALLAAPAAVMAQGVTQVTGEVLYRERIALPPSARVIIQLQDVSRADAPATVIAEQAIDVADKSPPFIFALTYDPKKIDIRFTYAVRAEIRDGNKVLFTTNDRYAVITQGNPTSGIQIIVRPVEAIPAPSPLPAALLDRDWNLTAIQRSSQSIENITSGGAATIRFSADGHVSGSGGCNSFGGTYTAGANQSLTFAPLVATLRACASTSVMTVEQEYFTALQSVSGYTLDSTGGLQLTFNNGQSLLRYSLPTTAQQQCFTQTSHCISGRFLSYWQQNGGLAVFGYPLTDAGGENGLTVQYFERQRFELHPENTAPYDVLIGRLGDEVLRKQGVDWFTLPKGSGPRARCLSFAATQHEVCDLLNGPSFLSYWQTHGLEFDGRSGKSYAESLALFGQPISEPFPANIEGQPVFVQWFERARFEWHPSNPAVNRVLLGRLGAELHGEASPAGIAEGASAPSELTLTATDNGKPVILMSGQTLVVRLDSNPSTGFGWQISQLDSAVLRQQGDPVFTGPASAPPGTGGALVFRFTAAAAGQTTLTLVYKRSFEPNEAPAATFTLPVTVQ